MPATIHEAAFKKQGEVHIMAGQDLVPEVLPPNFVGTRSHGLPVKQIPHYEFPKVVYMHPNQETQVIEHRNDKFELVGEEVVPTEHLTKVVACPAHIAGAPGAEKGKCSDCEKVLEEALAEGYVLEPYINKFIAGSDKRKQVANLYGKKHKKA